MRLLLSVSVNSLSYCLGMNIGLNTGDTDYLNYYSI
jgi:hypothetical protein